MGSRDRVREPQFDERLPSHTDTLRFAIDRAQQLHWEVDIDTLNLASGAPDILPIKMLVDLVRARVEEFVDFVSRNRGPSPPFCVRTLAFRALSHGGPR